MNLPSLAERRSDILVLADELLKQIGQSSGQLYTLDEAAWQWLQAYDYPGNIRELRNILWVAAVNSPDGCIRAVQVAAALPARISEPHSTSPAPVTPSPPTLQAVPASASGEVDSKPPPREVWEAGHLAMVLQFHGGNRRAVAEELGVSERTVYRKLKRFGLA